MILRAVKLAYEKHSEKYPHIFWKIDLHGVCLRSSYKSGEYEWINNDVVPALKEIMSCPHSKIILWSSCYEHEQQKIIDFFNNSGIRVDFFNENPMFANTEYGCFDQKFYFSILVDDKAGFDPDTEWKLIHDFLVNKNKQSNNDLNKRIQEVINKHMRGKNPHGAPYFTGYENHVWRLINDVLVEVKDYYDIPS